jgi:hypothetical protein
MKTFIKQLGQTIVTALTGAALLALNNGPTLSAASAQTISFNGAAAGHLAAQSHQTNQ